MPAINIMLLVIALSLVSSRCAAPTDLDTPRRVWSTAPVPMPVQLVTYKITLLRNGEEISVPWQIEFVQYPALDTLHHPPTLTTSFFARAKSDSDQVYHYKFHQFHLALHNITTTPRAFSVTAKTDSNASLVYWFHEMLPDSTIKETIVTNHNSTLRFYPAAAITQANFSLHSTMILPDSSLFMLNAYFLFEKQ